MFNTDVNPILLGWVDFSWWGACAYVSANAPSFVFSVAADVTAVVRPGMFVRLTQGTDKYFMVLSVGAFSGGVTPITIYSFQSAYTLTNTGISAGAFTFSHEAFGLPDNLRRGILSSVDVTSSVSVTGTSESGATTVLTCEAIAGNGSMVIEPEFDFETAVIGTTFLNFALFDAVDGGAAASIGYFGELRNSFTPISLPRWKFAPSAHIHVLSLRAWVDGGTGTIVAGAGSGAGVAMPGQGRIRIY